MTREAAGATKGGYYLTTAIFYPTASPALHSLFDLGVQLLDVARDELVVNVGSDGRAKSVTILKDPGSGFGNHARQCAMRRAWNPALDKNGIQNGSAPGRCVIPASGTFSTVAEEYARRSTSSRCRR